MSRTKPNDFVQIYSSGADSPMELTDTHLLYKHGELAPLAARNIKKGRPTCRFGGCSFGSCQGTQRASEWLVLAIHARRNDCCGRRSVILPCCHGLSGSLLGALGRETLMSVHHLSHIYSSPMRLLCIGVSSKLCEVGDVDDFWHPCLKFGVRLTH